MKTNRSLLEEALVDAKAVKATAFANAKAALEEAFSPFLKEKFSAKLAEMETEEEMNENEKVDETILEDESMGNEEVSLDELLAELDSEDENLNEKKDEEETETEEEIDLENMTEEDLESMIKNVIKDMVSAGELEAGHGDEEGTEDETGEETIDLDTDGSEESEDGELDETGSLVKDKKFTDDMDQEYYEENDSVDEEIDLDELLAELEETTKVKDPSPKSKNAVFSKGKDELKTPSPKAQINKAAPSVKKATKVSFNENTEEMDEVTAAQSGAEVSGDNEAIQAIAKALDTTADQIKAHWADLKDAFKNVASAAGSATSTMKEDEETDSTIESLRTELNEINLLNAKLLYTNKIFRNKSLNESQKVKVLAAFDKAASKKEVELVYETLLGSLKLSKAPIKESMGSASKVLGGTTSKPIIENDAFSRMRELAFGKKNN